MKGELRKTKSGKWQIRIYLCRDPKTAKKNYHIETVEGSESDAKKRRTILLAEKHTGKLSAPLRMTVEQYLDLWEKQSLANTVAPRTEEDYKALSRRYIIPELGHLRLDKITALDIQVFYNKLSKRNLSPRTVRYVHHVLSKALKQAMRWQMLQSNPLLDIQLPKMIRKEMKALTPEQTIAFLEAAKTDRYFALWIVAVDGGLRPEEYLGLQWPDLEDNALKIQRAVCWHRKEGGGWYFKDLKTPESRRTVALSPLALAALAIHKEQQKKMLFKNQIINEHNLIFLTSYGNPPTISNLRRKHFLPIIKRANENIKNRIEMDKNAKEFISPLPIIRMYDLRHTYATLRLIKNIHPKRVQSALGHSSYQITMDTYSHVFPSMMREDSDLIFADILSKIDLNSTNVYHPAEKQVSPQLHLAVVKSIE